MCNGFGSNVLKNSHRFPRSWTRCNDRYWFGHVNATDELFSAHEKEQDQPPRHHIQEGALLRRPIRGNLNTNLFRPIGLSLLSASDQQ